MSALGEDLPLLVAMVRTQAAMDRARLGATVDVDRICARLGSEEARLIARVLLGVERDAPPAIGIKAAAIRQLALGSGKAAVG